MSSSTRRLNLIALLLVVVAPSVGVYVAMMHESTRGTPFGKSIYAASKVFILAVPLVWLLLIEKDRLSFSPVKHGGVATGIMLGLIISAAIWITYLLFGARIIDARQLREAVFANGLDTPLKYIGLCAFLALVNALLEEYVWRWFVFRRCEVLLRSGVAAVILSGVFFTLHHILALHAQMGLAVTILGSIGVCVGGMTWSWLYLKYRSIWPGYISHLIVDVAIFIIGYRLIFNTAA